MGGDTLDESNYLKSQLSDHPDLKIASADTIEYAFQELRQPSQIVESKKTGALHQINEHKGFNDLMTAICGRHLLSPELGYMMDYDGHIVKNTKSDSRITYKQTEGYYPVVCSIDRLPVYMQNRNGNTPENYAQLSVIEAALNNCRKENIRIDSFRADACCYERKTIELLESRNITYYIRAENSRRLMDAMEDEPECQSVMLGHRKVDV